MKLKETIDHLLLHCVVAREFRAMVSCLGVWLSCRPLGLSKRSVWSSSKCSNMECNFFLSSVVYREGKKRQKLQRVWEINFGPEAFVVEVFIWLDSCHPTLSILKLLELIDLCNFNWHSVYFLYAFHVHGCTLLHSFNKLFIKISESTQDAWI